MPQAGQAADAPLAGFDANQAVTISPSLSPLDVAPGSAASVEATVQNQTTRAFRFSASTHDSPVRRGGSESFDFVGAGTQPNGLGAWLTVAPGDFVLQGGEQQRVRVRVRVPMGVAPGEYFGGVAYLGTPLDQGGGIRIRFEIKQVFLVTVGGAAKRDLRVDARPTDHWMWRGGRSTWIVTISNRGGTHEVYAGQVRFAGRFGTAPTIRLRSGVLLPGESRSIRVVANVRDAPDAIVARATIERANGPRVRATSATMVVLPWWFGLLVGAALLLVWRRLRRRPRRSSDGDGVPIAGS